MERTSEAGDQKQGKEEALGAPEQLKCRENRQEHDVRKDVKGKVGIACSGSQCLSVYA